MPRKLNKPNFRPAPDHVDHWNQTIAQSTGDFYAGRPATTEFVFGDDEKQAEQTGQAPQK